MKTEEAVKLHNELKEIIMNNEISRIKMLDKVRRIKMLDDAYDMTRALEESPH